MDTYYTTRIKGQFQTSIYDDRGKPVSWLTSKDDKPVKVNKTGYADFEQAVKTASKLAWRLKTYEPVLTGPRVYVYEAAGRWQVSLDEPDMLEYYYFQAAVCLKVIGKWIIKRPFTVPAYYDDAYSDQFTAVM